MEDLFISFGISAIIAGVKNPEKRVSLRRAFLKVFLAIKSAYIGDPDFQ